MFRNILVAVDGSPAAHNAVDIAGALASQYGARLNLLHVRRHAGDRPQEPRPHNSPPPSELVAPDGVIPFPGREIVAREAMYLQHRGLAAPNQYVESGDPASIILDFIKSRGIDLIVMGTRSRDRFDELLSDSLAYGVAKAAPCACLTVHDPSIVATSKDLGVICNGGSS